MKKIYTPQTKINPKEFIIDILITMLGTFVFAFAVHFFTAPNKIAPGGVSSISIIINYLTGFSIGTVNICLNIPLMVIGLIFLGKRFMLKTIISLVTFTVAIDYVLVYLPVYHGDKLLAAIFGGIIMGFGIGFVLTRGGSTGGMDIINRIILKKVPHMKLGKITLCTDLIIISISGIAYGSIEPVLYAAVGLYVCSTALDMVLYGFHICKLMYIVSDKAEEIAQVIMTQMNRGATILESYGAYTKQKKPTVMCAVRQNQYFKVKKIINAIDPNAFVIITSANEIVGSGFKSNDL
ncbi:YitT family protein [Paludicola sp. MB14-C6]|uniref:YitT family protein n=1 Tax=Paludihabitans sp. MB14-C6 TaxID=3070656 RepID=UPI0027DD7A89|nr:YitT family protein [Paludicola sp. MB14-C6]WMJ23067.1 YitT family protein [Paludicola sp. MB14-C6]